MKLTLTKPNELTTPAKILKFGLAIQEHKKRLVEFEKEFRTRTLDYMEKHGEPKIEDDKVTIQIVKGKETITHDKDVVMQTLGTQAQDYIKVTVDNSKLNKELNRYGYKSRPRFSPEQIGELNSNAIKVVGEKSIRISKKDDNKTNN